LVVGFTATIAKPAGFVHQRGIRRRQTTGAGTPPIILLLLTHKTSGNVLWETQMRTMSEEKQMIRRLLLVACLVCCIAFVLIADPAAPVATNNKVAVFTETQATAGKAEYLKTCATCHTESLIPSAGAQYQGRDIPPLAGAKFMEKWGDLTTRDLTARVKIAAGEAPHVNITAYILQFNGAISGEQPLTPETAVEIHAITN
jgi:mono/diheme cytochrome c family protein